MKNVLLINGHQKYEGFSEGKLNRTVIEETTKHLTDLGYETRITAVDAGYDVPTELDNYVWADYTFIQTPINSIAAKYMRRVV